MTYASIDIGTNTLRLLIAEVAGDGTLSPVVCERAITRLGGGYNDEDGISDASGERTISTLERFNDIITARGDVERVVCAATSVVRRAKNRASFLEEAATRAGFDVIVITESDEARLTLLGVRTVIGPPDRALLVIDIGGGSTEFAAHSGGGEGGGVEGLWSTGLGVVHLAEGHLSGDPPAAAGIASMEQEIHSTVYEIKKTMSGTVDMDFYTEKNKAILVGTAGTVTTLAALDQGLASYDPGRINNYCLPIGAVKDIYKRMSLLTHRERSDFTALEEGREDLIIPGAAIVSAVMDSFGFTEMTVSDAGLLEGLILDLAGTTRID